jgi:Tol biopolymer transport system component
MQKYVLILSLALAGTAFAQQPSELPQVVAYLKSGVLSDAGLWISTVDGKQRKRIAAFGMMPSWSPDGTRLAYNESPNHSSTRNLFVYDLRTKKATAFTKLKDEQAQVSSWSPDGKEIAYSTRGKRGRQLFIVDVTTQQVRRIVPSGGIDCASDPNWAPDGRSLAVRDCSTTQGGIALIEADGRLIRRVTKPESDAYDRTPVWTPDGKRIAFVSSRADKIRRTVDEPRHESIFLVNADGTDLHLLVTHNELSMSFPSWSSDGKLFACEAARPVPEKSAGVTLAVTKAIVMDAGDWKMRQTLGDNTGEPALAPMPR